MTQYSYTPAPTSEWLAVAGSGKVLVARVGDDDAARQKVAQLDLDRLSIHDALNALTSEGLSSTPAFSLCFWVQENAALEGVGVIVYGDAAVTAQTPDGPVTVAPTGVSGWGEQLVDGATALEIGDDDPAQALPLTGGAVWVSGIRVQIDGEAPFVDISGASAAAVAESAHEGEVPSGTAAAPVGIDEAEAEDALEGERGTEDGDQDVLDGDQDDAEEAAPWQDDSADELNDEASEPLETQVGTPAPFAPPPVPTELLEPVTAEQPVVDGADEPYAVHDDEDSGEDAPDAEDLAGDVPEVTLLPEDFEPAAAPGADIDESTIVRTPGEPVAAPREAPLGDHDGMTVLAEDVRAAREAAHLPVGDAATAQLPTFEYVLELPGGGKQPLDAPVVLGRAPSVSNVPASVLPHLVTLTGDDISRNHVRVAVEGDAVVVTDLHSSNGTLVVAPGRAPQQLRGGEQVPVIAGTTVDLGSGVTLRIVEA
ncbi:FHA domain-containing protein [Paramicrobacterium sp. CJ85]|uniref:FHA domain-containing protein n=1 Tax=Paramicrobacterium sp. CJ85 TaxID=3445355 RepID=UPI003F5FA4B9